MKIGKRKGKIKGISLLTGPGGISAQPECARAAGSPAWPASGGRQGRRCVRRPTCQRGGGNGVRGGDEGGGGRTDRSRPPVRFRGGSPSRSRFQVVREVAKHGWG
jgi:hypothetical protein